MQSVRVKPLIERLRTLGGTAKLVFDVIQYPYLIFWDSQDLSLRFKHIVAGLGFKNLLALLATEYFSVHLFSRDVKGVHA